MAEGNLGPREDSLKEKGLTYDINEGDGAFYGPKIDIKLKDALKRKWQCATIQCDFALPARFDLKYVDNEGKERQPVMLHRVILGSLERFLGALVEHYAGAFPLWLAPVQAVVIPIRKEDEGYAGGIKEKLLAEGIRVDLDAGNETLTKRIRNAELAKASLYNCYRPERGPGPKDCRQEKGDRGSGADGSG